MTGGTRTEDASPAPDAPQGAAVVAGGAARVACALCAAAAPLLLAGCESALPAGVMGANTGKSLLEIASFFLLILGVFWFMRGTRGETMLKSTTMILLVSFFLLFRFAKWQNLENLGRLLESVLSTSVIGIIVVFQPELRRGLMRLGENPFVKLFIKNEGNVVDELADAAIRLSKKKVGALIAIERESTLQSFMESATKVDAEVSVELIDTIFFPGSALHDGAIIIRGQRIAAAGCLFPLTDDPSISKALGTRHRAAIGLSEETDAVTLVVSEETGQVSVGVGGELHRGLDREGLLTLLRRLVVKGEPGDPDADRSKASEAPR